VLKVKCSEEQTMANTPFILVTAEMKDDNFQADEDAGLSSHLEKPFSAPILKQNIDSILISVA
jgi:two-component system chemotaxis response regulator CheY